MKLIPAILALVSARKQVCANANEAWPRLKELTGHANMGMLVNKNNLLAQGGSARVYLTPFGKKQVAFKIVSLATHRDVEKFEREVKFLREAKDNTGVAALRGCVMGSINGKNFGGFFIEYLPMTLEQLAPQIPTVELGYRFKLYARLAGDLAMLHLKGVLHNDYKPRNVVVGGSDVLLTKIIDFGESCRVGELCKHGTELYAAPEKIGKVMQSIGSEAVDVWAFLITIFELEAGGMDYPDIAQTCFTEKMTVTCFEQFRAHLVSLLNHSPLALVTLLVDSLRYDPAERPSMKELYLQFVKLGETLA